VPQSTDDFNLRVLAQPFCKALKAAISDDIDHRAQQNSATSNAIRFLSISFIQRFLALIACAAFEAHDHVLSP